MKSRMRVRAAAILVLLLLGGSTFLLVAPSFTNAQTQDNSALIAAIRSIIEESVNELSAEVQSLRNEVQTLRAELQSTQLGSGGVVTTAPLPPPELTVLAATLKSGDSGEAVRQLQEVLIRLGFAIPAGITGNFRAQTEQALREVQTRYNVPVTGTLDAATREVLNRLVQPLNQPPQVTEPVAPGPVVAPQIVLISPQSGMFLNVGTNIPISWRVTGAPAGSRMVFRLVSEVTGASNAVLETTELEGSQAWSIPSFAATENEFIAELYYGEGVTARVLASKSASLSVFGGTTEAVTPTTNTTTNTTNTNTSASSTGSSSNYNQYVAFYTGSAFTTCMAAYPETITLIKGWLDQGLSRYQFPWGQITGAAASKVAECEGNTFSNDTYNYSTSNSNWVYKNWTFVNGMGQGSYILNRTDNEYTTFINGVYNDCAGKYFAGWKPGGGNESSWQEFGIPECSATDTGYTSSPSYGGGSSAQCSSGFHFEYYEGSSVICFSDSGSHDRYQVDQGSTILCSDAWRNGCSGSSSGGGSGTSTMYSCFYPDATVNGTPPGYTVWCEYDYQNCHQGDSSGAPVSTDGLSLGAPSSCESGGPTSAAPASPLLANIAAAVANAWESLKNLLGF